MANIQSPNIYGTAYVDALPEHVNGVLELQAASGLLQDAPSISSYLLDRSIHTDDKARALSIALPDASDETRHFILLLAHEGALKNLERIIKRTKEIYAEREDRVLAEVTSAVPLMNDELTNIANALHARLGKAVLVETAVDETLHGGITVRINDWFYDASLRGRMERLKQHLATGSS